MGESQVSYVGKKAVKLIIAFSQVEVDLRPTPAIIHAPGLHDFPSNTKVKADNQATWYKQFAR